MARDSDELIRRFEQLIRRDPANRGLIGQDGSGPGSGELLPATRLFAESGGVVGIVTGFFIPRHDAPNDTAAKPHGVAKTDFSAFGNAETDGPPGAALLAAVLAELGFTPRVLTDQACKPVVTEAIVAVGLSAEIVAACPVEQHESRQWVRQFAASEEGAQLTHLVAVERVGPSHHQNSIQQNDPAAVESGDFERHVPESAFDRCFNMRGEAIDDFTAALHALFPERQPATSAAREAPTWTSDAPAAPVATVGIGDGGNEIGMGRFPWSHLRERIRGASVAHIPCRIATDQTVVAGTSNLGAFALAASIAAFRGRIDVLERHSCEAQWTLLERIVERAGAVDGVTKVAEPTVDGVPFLTGIQPWAAIRRELGLPE